MKHKFNSMGRVAIALVLALSLCLVMAVPVAAQEPPTAAVKLIKGGDGVAEWSKDQAHSGSYSVKLENGSGGGANAGRIEMVVPASPIADLINPTYFAWDSIGGSEASYLNILLDTDDDGLWDDKLEGHGTALVPATTWTQVSEVTGYYDMDMSLEVTETATETHDLAWWKAALPAGVDVVGVQITYGYCAWENDAIFYIDDVTIGGVTYDLEPPGLLDADFYKTDDTVTVTVSASETGTVGVYVSSDIHPLMGPVALTETPADSGIFVGTFKLVDTTPAPGELLVGDGNTVTVGYPDLSGITETATVDDTAPVVAITAPEDGDFVAGESVSITWTITDTNEGPFSVTIGDKEVATTGTTYPWNTKDTEGEAVYPEGALWPDGAYTIEVVATDLAELVGSDSIDVTVDNTLPVIENAEATPPVVKPGEENTIVFTADVTDTNIDTVTIDLSSIGGDLDTAMLDGGVAPDEAVDGTYTAEITTTIAAAGSKDLTVTATDKATNEATADIELGVSPDTIPPVISDPAITYPFGISSAEPSDEVTLTATVTDNEAMAAVNPVTAACDVFVEEDPVTLIKGEDNIYTGKGTVKSDAGWGDYPVTITATDAEGNKATDETLILAVRYGATGTTIELVKGWNLISLPLIPSDADITVVISATTLDSGDIISVGTVLGYDPATGDFPRYIPGTGGALTEMEDGQGYWVFMEEDDTLTITGRQLPVPPAVPPTYDVVVGWNLIGFKSMTNMIDYEAGPPEVGYLLNIAGTYPVLWSYNATTGAYSNVKDVTDGMVVGHGFWIWITEAGTIVPPQ